MNKVLIIGAGRIGSCAAKLLAESGDYKVTLADAKPAALKKFKITNLKTAQLDVYNKKELAKHLKDADAVLSAATFNESKTIAESALKTGASYFDLTEDVAATKAIQALAKNAKKGQIFMPQCGLAPGFVGILANYIGQKFDDLSTLKLRVGALPEFPSNQLMYNLTWSTEGLINEYCNPCEAIKNGSYTQLRPLEGLEQFSLDGVDFEAFNTSGGLGTLCETLNGKVKDLTYKTIRYPGHRHLMDFLIHGLHLGESAERRGLLQQIFENAIAITRQDVVIVFVTATGYRKGQLEQISEYYRIYHGELQGHDFSAIQISTASSICAVVDMHFNHQLPSKGFVKQEDVDFTTYIDNRFCLPYRQGKHRTKAI